MNAAELHQTLEDHGAVLRGHFKLSSGLHSDLYVQCALALQWPGLAGRIGQELADRLSHLSPTAVLGPAMGGLIIGHEVARRLGVRAVFCERADGTMSLRRGFAFEPHDRVAVVEDVVSTGRSQKEAIGVVRGAGAIVAGVGAVVDRSGGAAFGIPFESLLKLDAEAWPAERCPLCAAGDEPAAPGSRHLSGR